MVSFDSRLYIWLHEGRRCLYIFMPEWLVPGGGAGRSLVGLNRGRVGAVNGRGEGCGGGRGTVIAISCSRVVEGVDRRLGGWRSWGERGRSLFRLKVG